MINLRKLSIVSSILFIWLGAFALPGQAQVESVTLKVDGLACPFCAYGLSKELKKVEGIKDARVFVDEGKVELDVKTGKPVDIDKLPEAVRNGGFTPKEIRLTAVGRVEEWNGRHVLAVEPGGLKLLLEENENFRRLHEALGSHGNGRRVTVSGQVETKIRKSHHTHPLTLQIEQFEVN